MCIYLKEEKNLHYDSAEHIIPKGLGGIKVLPKEYVSREFNNRISKLEQELLRESPISFFRQLIGPGKRGSLKDKDATKSKILLISKVGDETNYSIGYTQKTMTFQIPQVKINIKSGLATFSLDLRITTDSDLAFNEFKSLCNSPENLKIKSIFLDRLDENTIIWGIQDKVEENFNAFFVKNKDNLFELTHENIKKIGNAIKNDNPEQSQNQQIVEGSFYLDLNHLRIFGKVAFNFLASATSLSFVLDERFDNIRNWIAHGSGTPMGNYNLTNLNWVKDANLPFPQDGHFVYIMKYDNDLVARVLLGNLTADIILSNHFPDQFKTIGLFCDWKNHCEYDLEHYFRKIYLGKAK